jgi:hypothetical protein
LRNRSTHSTILAVFLAACMGTGLTACGNKQHKEVLALAKCIKAANYLQDGTLEAAADYRARTVMKDVQGSAKYAMEIGQELRDEAEPQGSSTNLGHIFEVAREWKTSDYCVQVESDFAAHIDGQVMLHSQPVADRNADPASCQKYVEQFDVYASRHTSKHRAEMEKAVHATLEGSLGKLKEFQLDAARKKLQGEDFRQFAREIYEGCKGGGALSEKISLAKSMQALQSPATKQIKEYLLNAGAPRRDCGEFAQDYCKSELMLQAAELALAKSEECDRNGGDGSCSSTAEVLILREFDALEKEQLLSMQEKYTNYMADPEKADPNARSNIGAIADVCKMGAISRGMRNTEYTAYVAATCMPNARRDFLKPTAEKLARINAHLSS